MDQSLAGKSIAILVSNGFEEAEMTEPQRALIKTGANLRTISTETGLVNGWHGKSWGHYFPVDKHLSEALGADFDMLLLPGGERSVAKLQQSAHTRRIVGHFLDAGKPIAAIDQGIQLLAIPGKLRGRLLAAPEAYRADLTAAGGRISDEALVVDDVTVSALGQDQLNEFVEAVVKLFTELGSVRKAA
ncbi:DJ-1/PfpI family protein [Azospirillum lipoferum]|uniref:Intracellular protease n=1 Tax=Azospirillum lipoferum (strain 4B) TaxID=862719 RepID=G7ZGN4_AZOL4|nr:DJ-1/PfpI family protein [Azospirillum lipoferum]CBS91005.1 putative intracellular protease [Azospirillum lipoferum 4B]